MASYSHWAFIEQCRGCGRLIDTQTHPFARVHHGASVAFWHLPCIEDVDRQAPKKEASAAEPVVGLAAQSPMPRRCVRRGRRA